jgi:hypothetical protein
MLFEETLAAAGRHHPAVGAVRADLASTGEIPQLEKTVGDDGKARSARPRRVAQLIGNEWSHLFPGEVTAENIDLPRVGALFRLGQTRSYFDGVVVYPQFTTRPRAIVAVEDDAAFVNNDRDLNAALGDVLFERRKLLGRQFGQHLVWLTLYYRGGDSVVHAVHSASAHKEGRAATGCAFPAFGDQPSRARESEFSPQSGHLLGGALGFHSE